MTEVTYHMFQLPLNYQPLREPSDLWNEEPTSGSLLDAWLLPTSCSLCSPPKPWKTVSHYTACPRSRVSGFSPHLLICPVNIFSGLLLEILTDDASWGRGGGKKICYHLNFPSFFIVIDFPLEEWWQVDEVISLSPRPICCPPEIQSKF